MKFKDIVNNVGYLDTYKALKKYYPDFNHDTIVAHLKVLMDLKDMEVKDSPFIINCEYVEGFPEIDLDFEGYWNVFGTLDDNTDGMTYALEFTPWAEWLSMECVYPYALDACEFVAHCLYEMTFCGFNETTIQNLESEIRDNIHEIVGEFHEKDLDIKSVCM